MAFAAEVLRSSYERISIFGVIKGGILLHLNEMSLRDNRSISLNNGTQLYFDFVINKSTWSHYLKQLMENESHVQFDQNEYPITSTFSSSLTEYYSSTMNDIRFSNSSIIDCISAVIQTKINGMGQIDYGRYIEHFGYVKLNRMGLKVNITLPSSTVIHYVRDGVITANHIFFTIRIRPYYK